MGIAAGMEQESGVAVSQRLRALRGKPCMQKRLRAENGFRQGSNTREPGLRSGSSAEALSYSCGPASRSRLVGWPAPFGSCRLGVKTDE
jgi:hypothetical protein